ncbi:hypothetical protein ACFLWG_00740 [Chloroflexota bacterium]
MLPWLGKHSLGVEPSNMVTDRFLPGSGGEAEFLTRSRRTHQSVAAQYINGVSGEHRLPPQ